MQIRKKHSGGKENSANSDNITQGIDGIPQEFIDGRRPEYKVSAQSHNHTEGEEVNSRLTHVERAIMTLGNDRVCR